MEIIKKGKKDFYYKCDFCGTIVKIDASENRYFTHRCSECGYAPITEMDDDEIKQYLDENEDITDEEYCRSINEVLVDKILNKFDFVKVAYVIKCLGYTSNNIAEDLRSVAQDTLDVAYKYKKRCTSVAVGTKSYYGVFIADYIDGDLTLMYTLQIRSENDNI